MRKREERSPLKVGGLQGGEEGRLKEWRMIYDVEERDCGDKKEIGKEKTNTNQVFVNKGNYQFTFIKKVEKVKESAAAEKNRGKEKSEQTPFG